MTGRAKSRHERLRENIKYLKSQWDLYRNTVARH